MCEYYSCIVYHDNLTNDITVYDLEKSSSHEDIIKRFNLDDSELENRSIVRVEITPIKPMAFFSSDRSNWTFKFDEESTLPSWVDDNLMRIRELCFTSWEKSLTMIHSKLNVPRMLELIEEVENIPYLDNHGEINPDWHMYDNRDAVRDAVGDAVRDARLYVLVNSLPDMNQEHIDYMDRRMNVWKQGYGCYCDLDGELYCYKKVF